MFAGICNTTELIFYHQQYFPILKTWNFCEYTRIDISVRLIAAYSWYMVNLFSFGCHVTDRAYVRTYVRTRLQIARVG